MPLKSCEPNKSSDIFSRNRRTEGRNRRTTRYAPISARCNKRAEKSKEQLFKTETESGGRDFSDLFRSHGTRSIAFEVRVCDWRATRLFIRRLQPRSGLIFPISSISSQGYLFLRNERIPVSTCVWATRLATPIRDSRTASPAK